MLITNDVHDISSRLKEIDPNYTLHWNPASSRYELHGKRDECIIVFPYAAIDERMITHARRTRRERIEALVREMESANLAAEARAEHAQNSAIEDIVREGADKYYAERRRKGDY